MDYCHNVAGLESMADFVGRLGAPKSIGMISMPGDRKDEDIIAFGELAARTFNQLVIREDVNRRGRKDGEIAEILKQSAVNVGMSPEDIHIVLEEMDASKTAIDLAEPRIWSSSWWTSRPPFGVSWNSVSRFAARWSDANPAP